MTMLETPSRIWRRIEAVEGREMPSLPSLPAFEDSAEESELSEEHSFQKEDFDYERHNLSTAFQSTPAASSHNGTTVRARSSTSSTERFAHSIASRLTKSSSLGISSASGERGFVSTRGQLNSLDISIIPSLHDTDHDSGRILSRGVDEIEGSKESIPDIYLPPDDDEDQDLSLTDALESISRSSSPHGVNVDEATPKKSYDYSVSLRSEPKPSPFDKFHNVALRKPLARTRTPSLSRTTPSPVSSPTNSTPHSNRSAAASDPNADSPYPGISIPLPRSNTASPVVIVHKPEDDMEELATDHSPNQSPPEFDDHMDMDVTDVHISPISSDADMFRRKEDHEPGIDSQQGKNSDEETEPTFSSDGMPTPYALQTSRSPVPPPNASSPLPLSTAFTPSPAMTRPQTRFNLPTTPHDLLLTPNPSAQQEIEQDEDSLTPHTRRRSFLLSVINSTARPRMKFPTPHPRKSDMIYDTTDTTESTPAGRGSLRHAFAGVTPRPKATRRMSHPLSQGFTVSSGMSGSAVSPGTVSEQDAQDTLPPWVTPAQASPYDGMSDRASFISTASSHDLTTHPRANTSFDPVMGLGAQGHGLGRFNAGKLNTYLHGLNRRLQEENEALLERLRRIEEEKGLPVVGRRLSDGGRRISLGGTNLGNVEEDVDGEGWVEEKAELEEIIEGLQSEVAKRIDEKQEIEKALEEEKAERARDKERWKERMGEVEKGVEGIVQDLEAKLQVMERRAKTAEDEGWDSVRTLERRLAEAEEERDLALERASKAERAMESGQELGSELKIANERIGHLMSDLRNANAQIKDLEREVMQSDARVDEMEKDLKEKKRATDRLEKELQAKAETLATEHDMAVHQADEARKLEAELISTKTYVAELEEHAEAAIEQVESLATQLIAAQEKVSELERVSQQEKAQVAALEHDAEGAHELARQMEEALQAAEQKMLVDEEEITQLKGAVVSLERERERAGEASMMKDPSRSSGPANEEIEVLEAELDDAHKEIARLNTLLHQSPARKAVEKAKDAKIQLLEKEKEELMERVKALRTTMTEIHTPARVANLSGISPIHRQLLSMSMREPKTPGGPLKEMSWLNSTPGNPEVSPLIAEISRLQRELDRANESIDDKLVQLEDVGLDVVGLTKKLEDARATIIRLEDEVARLTRKEERRLHRLERLRCRKCLIKFDLHAISRDGDESTFEMSNTSLPTKPPTPPTKTSDALRAKVHAVNAELSMMKIHWEEEKERLLNEKAALQNTAHRLNAQVHNTREEAKRALETDRARSKKQATLQEELDEAKNAISGLEADLKSERARMRVLTTEQNRLQREKSEVLAQLHRTESDMHDVKRQLQKKQQENTALEAELRSNTNTEQKARLLEVKVAENTDTIEQLRQERSLLAAEHRELQHRFSQTSEQVARLREEHATSQKIHDDRRHRLDMNRVEIEELRTTLAEQANELAQAEIEKQRAENEKRDVSRTIAVLEADLRRVRKDAEAFGRDLKLLRAEKERLEANGKEETAKAHRAHKQSVTQIKLLNEQLDDQRAILTKAREELAKHTCAIDEHQLAGLRLRHNKECKGLMLQIRYLKAKFTRESAFRSHLGYQKQYLLVLLSGMKISEETIIASIARIGFPLPPIPIPKPRKLKVIGLIILFLLRVKNATEAWREEYAVRQAIVEALQEVRRKRAIVHSPTA